MVSSSSLVPVCLAWLASVVAVYSMDTLQDVGFQGSDIDDDLLQSLYKRLTQMDPADLQDFDDLQSTVIEGQRESRENEGDDNQATDIRDPEYLEHSANSGFIHMSGGAGEGSQHLKPDGSLNNSPQVKSDESLPFYCHPPNPCPKGYTSKDGCQEFVEDSADYQKEWITQMESKGICSCDEEHMFDCSSSNSKSILKPNAEEKEGPGHEFDAVFRNLLDEKHDNPFTSGGQKRKSLVAKKSPRVKRSSSENNMEMELKGMEKMVKPHHQQNPYLAGERLRTVAKKGARTA